MPLWGKKEKGGSQTTNEPAMSAPNGAAKGGGGPPQEARPRPQTCVPLSTGTWQPHWIHLWIYKCQGIIPEDR